MELSEYEVALAGLNGMKRKPVNPDVVKFQNALLLKEGSKLFRRQFIEQLHNLPDDAIKGLMAGSYQILDKKYYARRVFSGSTTDIVFKSTTEAVGESNMKDGKVDENNPFVLSAISLEYSATDLAGFSHAQLPDDIKRGEFSLKYKDKEWMTSEPIAAYFSNISNYNTDKPYAYFELNNPKVFLEKNQITFTVNIPTAFAAGTHSVGVIFHGTEAREL